MFTSSLTYDILNLTTTNQSLRRVKKMQNYLLVIKNRNQGNGNYWMNSLEEAKCFLADNLIPESDTCFYEVIKIESYRKVML